MESGVLVIEEISRTLVECWKNDVRRVGNEFNITNEDAEKMIATAAGGDGAAQKQLEPLHVGQVKMWANGPWSTWDEPENEDSLTYRRDHWRCRLIGMAKEIAGWDSKLKLKLQSGEIEARSGEHQWEEHLQKQFSENAVSEGLRLDGDSTPWLPEFYNTERIAALHADRTVVFDRAAQSVQEAVWAALVMPPADEQGDILLLLIRETFIQMFQNGCSPDAGFVDPMTHMLVTPMEYAAQLAQEAQRRQTALHMAAKKDEEKAAEWETAAMLIVLEAIFAAGGENFSEDPNQLARAKYKQEKVEHTRSVKSRPVGHKLPRGYVPGYKTLNNKYTLIGANDPIAKQEAKAASQTDKDFESVNQYLKHDDWFQGKPIGDEETENKFELTTKLK